MPFMLFIWQFVGAIIIFLISVNWEPQEKYCWFLDPKEHYEYGFTWFSSYLRAILLWLICPTWTLIYWFNRACNMRRIDE